MLVPYFTTLALRKWYISANLIIYIILLCHPLSWTVASHYCWPIFMDPRSLKCNSKNGGLPKPAPEHVYAVVDRSFLCDCQLDLEHHATILRQLSACTDNRTTHFQVEFVVNLGFYQLLRNRCPNLVENIRPNAKG